MFKTIYWRLRDLSSIATTNHPPPWHPERLIYPTFLPLFTIINTIIIVTYIHILTIFIYAVDITHIIRLIRHGIPFYNSSISILCCYPLMIYKHTISKFIILLYNLIWYVSLFFDWLKNCIHFCMDAKKQASHAHFWNFFSLSRHRRNWS